MSKLNLNKFHKGIVRIDGIWRPVLGEKVGCDFYYILHGKINVAFDGHYYSFSGSDITQREVDNEAIRLNIHDMRRGSRRR